MRPPAPKAGALNQTELLTDVEIIWSAVMELNHPSLSTTDLQSVPLPLRYNRRYLTFLVRRDGVEPPEPEGAESTAQPATPTVYRRIKLNQ